MHRFERDFPPKKRPAGPAPWEDREARTYEEFRLSLNTRLPNIRAKMQGFSRNIASRLIPAENRYVGGRIRVRCYRPADMPEAIRPAFLYLHGGGWFGGSTRSTGDFCRLMADKTDSAVFSADYRLAPEHPFPAGFNDCRDVLAWLWQNAEELRIDRHEITVCGDSAGGNLTAAVCLAARDEGEILVKNQIMLYPAASQADGDLSAPELEDVPRDPESPQLWPARVIREWYAPNPADWLNPYVSPLRANDLRNLPRAFILALSMDGLFRQGCAYAEALDAAGNDVTLAVYHNAVHGFVDYTGNAHAGAVLADDLRAFLQGA